MKKETQHSLFEPRGCILVGNSLPIKPNRWGSCFSGPGPLEPYEKDHYSRGKEVDQHYQSRLAYGYGPRELCEPEVEYPLMLPKQ